MEEVADLGLSKAIGVSNFTGGLLIDLFRSATIKVRVTSSSPKCSLIAVSQPAILQIEHHPLLTQEPLLALASHLNVAVTACESTTSCLGPSELISLRRLVFRPR